METAQIIMPVVPQAPQTLPAAPESFPGAAPGENSNDIFLALLDSTMLQKESVQPEALQNFIPAPVFSNDLEPVVSLEAEHEGNVAPDAQQNAMLVAATMQAAMMVPLNLSRTVQASSGEVIEESGLTDVQPAATSSLNQETSDFSMVAVEGEQATEPGILSSLKPEQTESTRLNEPAVPASSEKQKENFPKELIQGKNVTAVKEMPIQNNNGNLQLNAASGGIEKVSQEQASPMVSGQSATNSGNITLGDEQRASETVPVKNDGYELQKKTDVQSSSQRFAAQPGVQVEAMDESSNKEPGNGGARGREGRLTSHSEESPDNLTRTARTESQPADFQHATTKTGTTHETGAGNHVGLFNNNVQKIEQPVAPENIRLNTPTLENVARQVSERLSVHDFKKGEEQISIKLSPEHLGNLQLNVRMEDQRLRLEIVAEHRAVRDALMQQAEELRETLSRQNIKMDSFNVTTGNSGNMGRGHYEWQQTTPDPGKNLNNYAGKVNGYGAEAHSGAGVRYFAPQYQSTIDVRF